MDHPRCKTCAHFEPDSAEWDTPITFGDCELLEMTSKMTKWDDDFKKQTLKPEFKEHLAGVMDGSSYHAALHPSPEFYCAMHSELMPHLAQPE